MEYVHVDTYYNYVDANIILGRLREENIECWLKDENMSTIMPVWNQATGGIRLMVLKDDAEKAVQLLEQFKMERQAKRSCPYCGSSNIELITSPRKATTWISALITFFLSDYAIAAKTQYHCFDCKREFKVPKENQEERE